MIAIVEIAGLQYKVKKDQKLYVNRLDTNEGETVDFDKVLLIESDENVSVGKPYLEGVKVSASVVNHLKDDKKLIFKKKRRKGYKVLRGHRQPLSLIQIAEITA